MNQQQTFVTVLNLNTGTEYHYGPITPREAVIAAHAQSEREDWNTWDYEKKYGQQVRLSRSGLTVSCGNCTALVKPMAERRAA